MMNRRRLLAAGIALSARAQPRTAYHLATTQHDIQMTVEFHDRYSSTGFQFRDLAGRSFCLSASGDANRNCAAGFTGSLAIVRYMFRPAATALRERVRTIDQSPRLDDRPPFDRTIGIRDGVASDIQAFGYPEPIPSADSGLWYYFRQDLYLDANPAPFLVVHWRHTSNAIRILDVIPGEGTWLVS